MHAFMKQRLKNNSGFGILQVMVLLVLFAIVALIIQSLIQSYQRNLRHAELRNRQNEIVDMLEQSLIGSTAALAYTSSKCDTTAADYMNYLQNPLFCLCLKERKCMNTTIHGTPFVLYRQAPDTSVHPLAGGKMSFCEPKLGSPGTCLDTYNKGLALDWLSCSLPSNGEECWNAISQFQTGYQTNKLDVITQVQTQMTNSYTGDDYFYRLSGKITNATTTLSATQKPVLLPQSMIRYSLKGDVCTQNTGEGLTDFIKRCPFFVDLRFRVDCADLTVSKAACAYHTEKIKICYSIRYDHDPSDSKSPPMAPVSNYSTNTENCPTLKQITDGTARRAGRGTAAEGSSSSRNTIGSESSQNLHGGSASSRSFSARSGSSSDHGWSGSSSESNSSSFMAGSASSSQNSSSGNAILPTPGPFVPGTGKPVDKFEGIPNTPNGPYLKAVYAKDNNNLYLLGANGLYLSNDHGQTFSDTGRYLILTACNPYAFQNIFISDNNIFYNIFTQYVSASQCQQEIESNPLPPGWGPMGSGLPGGPAIAYSGIFSKGNNVYVATSSGVYLSTNSGRDFLSAGSAAQPNDVVTDGAYVYIAQNNGFYIYNTTDLSGSPKRIGPKQKAYRLALSDGRVFVLTENGLYRSSSPSSLYNDPANPALLTQVSGFPTTNILNQLVTSGSHVYATAGGQLYHSADYGATVGTVPFGFGSGSPKAHYAPPAEAVGVPLSVLAAQGPWVYGINFTGLSILNTSDIANSSVSKYPYTSGAIVGISAQGTKIDYADILMGGYYSERGMDHGFSHTLDTFDNMGIKYLNYYANGNNVYIFEKHFVGSFEYNPVIHTSSDLGKTWTDQNCDSMTGEFVSSFSARAGFYYLVVTDSVGKLRRLKLMAGGNTPATVTDFPLPAGFNGSVARILALGDGIANNVFVATSSGIVFEKSNGGGVYSGSAAVPITDQAAPSVQASPNDMQIAPYQALNRMLLATSKGVYYADFGSEYTGTQTAMVPPSIPSLSLTFHQDTGVTAGQNIKFIRANLPWVYAADSSCLYVSTDSGNSFMNKNCAGISGNITALTNDGTNVYVGTDQGKLYQAQ